MTKTDGEFKRLKLVDVDGVMYVQLRKDSFKKMAQIYIREMSKTRSAITAEKKKLEEQKLRTEQELEKVKVQMQMLTKQLEELKHV